MVERNGSAALSRTLFTTVSGALGGLLVFLITIMISVMTDLRSDVAEIKGAMPHFQRQLDAHERRLDRVETRQNGGP